jgi:hypothetical protein
MLFELAATPGEKKPENQVMIDISAEHSHLSIFIE